MSIALAPISVDIIRYDICLGHLKIVGGESTVEEEKTCQVLLKIAKE